MKAVLTAIAVILVTFFLLDNFTLHQEIRSLQAIVAKLQAEQRPLIIVKSKYPSIFASKDLVEVATND